MEKYIFDEGNGLWYELQGNHVNNLYSIALHKYVHYNVHLSVIFPSFHHV